jgi:hypothetical protein
VQRTQGTDLRQFRFAMPDGGVACVCLEAGTGGSGPALRLDRYVSIGELTSVRTIDDWLPNGLVTGLEDAVLSPDGSEAVVASLVALDGGWGLRVQRIPFDATVPVVEREAPVDLATNADPNRLEVRAALAPDGSRLRVSVLQAADDAAGLPSLELGWDVAWDGSAWGQIQGVPSLATRDAQPATCQARAWVTPTVFFEGCLANKVQDDGSQELFARIDDGTGAANDIGLGFVPFLDPVGWLVDGTHGVLYGWTSMSHQLYRIQLPGKLTLRVMGTGALAGHPGLADVPPEASVPPASPRRVQWQPTGSASEPLTTPLVGSSDGLLLYAAGLAFPTGPDAVGTGVSTGIWTFDAGSLALDAHWPAAAAYDDVGLTPDGRYLIALGGPNADELGRFGNHGPELVIHDPVDGSIVVILRSLVAAYGGIPGMLPAGPGLG